MLNIIWSGLILISLITSFFAGTFEECSMAAINGAGEGVTLAISLCGAMCFWNGIMEIASKSGALNVLSYLLSPFTKFIFPEIKKESMAMKAIVMNITANILGMSNAATPMGLRAMEELQKLNNDKKRASKSMCMFVLLNTASVQLIPTTLITLRATSGISNPTAVIVPVWITSSVALAVGVMCVKIFEKVKK